MADPENAPQLNPDETRDQYRDKLLARSSINHTNAAKNRLGAWLLLLGGTASLTVDVAQLTHGSSWEKQGFDFMLDAAALGVGVYNARQTKINQQRSQKFLDWAKEVGAGSNPLALPEEEPTVSPAYFAPADHTQLRVVVREVLNEVMRDKGVDLDALKQLPPAAGPAADTGDSGSLHQ